MSGLDRDMAPIVAEELKRYMPDLVEVVRCKDCIHAKEMTQYGCGECVRHCEKLKIVTSPEWFCAEGRRNNETALQD